MTRFISSRSRSVRAQHLSGYCSHTSIQSFSVSIHKNCFGSGLTDFLKLLLLQDLHKKYSYIRKTRPDGNCFYRAFGFAHLESLLDDSKELQRWVPEWLLCVLCWLLVSMLKFTLHHHLRRFKCVLLLFCLFKCECVWAVHCVLQYFKIRIST